MVGVLMLGEHAIGTMLVASQVVLSMQLPFALYPLISFTGQRAIMGNFANKWWVSTVSWLLFIVISAANGWLVAQVLAG
jgi:manganese transport protein